MCAKVWRAVVGAVAAMKAAVVALNVSCAPVIGKVLKVIVGEKLGLDSKRQHRRGVVQAEIEYEICAVVFFYTRSWTR